MLKLVLFTFDQETPLYIYKLSDWKEYGMDIIERDVFITFYFQ